jgi:kynurenine formamidase
VSRIIDLSHPLVDGEQTYPWLPAPRVTELVSREASRLRYAAGTEFVIHAIEVTGNSGTYVDAPFHRYPIGADLAELPLARVANLPGIVIPVGHLGRSIGPETILELNGAVNGAAVLFRTGWDRLWGTSGYQADAPHLTREAAEALVERGAKLVGIDALNIDDTGDLTRPAHSVLLGAGIPIVENLCQPQLLPEGGFRFFAVPAAIRGCGAFPVRAFALLD